jgi:hypothetical protein
MKHRQTMGVLSSHKQDLHYKRIQNSNTQKKRSNMRMNPFRHHETRTRWDQHCALAAFVALTGAEWTFWTGDNIRSPRTLNALVSSILIILAVGMELQSTKDTNNPLVAIVALLGTIAMICLGDSIWSPLVFFVFAFTVFAVLVVIGLNGIWVPFKPAILAQAPQDDIDEAEEPEIEFNIRIRFISPELQQLQRKTSTNPDQSKQDNVCAICMEEYSESKEPRWLPCFHKFHKDCVDQWLSLRPVCPCCVREV